MTSRDQRLAQTKYAGQKSASQAAAEKTSSRVPSDAGGSVLDQLRAFNKDDPKPVERDAASVARAAAHKRNLPPIGG